jgi:hypothetical protein
MVHSTFGVVRGTANMRTRGALRLAAAALAAVCMAGCAVEDAPDEQTGVATDALVSCLSTDETLSYPSSYVLKNPNGTPLLANQDITFALQTAIDAQALTNTPTPPTPTTSGPVIVIPQGTFYLTSTIRIRASLSTQIVGAVSAGGSLPVIKWAGAAGDDMFFIDWAWWTRFNRLVIDGNGTARIGLHFTESKQRFTMSAGTNTMTTAYPVLNNTPMMVYGNVPNGLAEDTVYFVRKTGAAYYLAPDATCLNCQIDLGSNGGFYFIIGSGFNSYDHEITDVSLRNMKYGVVGGTSTMDYDNDDPNHELCPGSADPKCVRLAEPGLEDTGSDVGTVTIRRSTFSFIGQQGVVANTYNVIDWGIFDSTFESSKIGVFIGVGQASIFNSRFRLNTTRDISVATWGYNTIRENVSVGSKQFLKTHGGEYSVTVINNKVVAGAPQGVSAPAMELRNRTFTLLDNQVAPAPSQPAMSFVEGLGYKSSDIVYGNNTTPQPIVFPSTPAHRLVQAEPNVVAPVSVSWPPKPPPAPWFNRTTTEVTANAAGQCCVLGLCDECATKLANPADGSAVHFAAGVYKLSQPITVPANRNILYYGDGNATQLYWVRNNAAYVAPGTGPTPTVFFDLVGSSRASIRELKLSMYAPTAPDHGYVGGISIRSADDVGSRVFVDETKIMTGAKYGVDVNGFDNLATRLDMVAIGPAEVPIRAKGKGAGAQGGSSATQGVLAFGGEYAALADAFRVEGYGKLVSQGADLEGYTQGAIVDGSGFLTVSSSRIFAGNAAFVGCKYGLPTSYPQHANYGIASTFLGRATFSDMWTTGRFVGDVSPVPSGQFLALNVGNNFSHMPDPTLPDADECGGHFVSPPESAYAYPPEPACGSGASDEIGQTCPFVSLASTAVAAGTQASINGRFLYPVSSCSVPCQPEANVASTYVATMLSDLRAANSAAQPTQCGPTDVRIRRVLMAGRFVGPSDQRQLEYGIRVQ